MKTTFTFLTLIFCLLIISCDSTNQDSEDYNPHVDETNTNEEDGIEENGIGGASEHKFKSRSGNSGEYEYSYDVAGSDENGNSVYGNVDMQGKYGSGYLENDNGEEVEIEAEWVDYGEIEATDDDGNTYDLEVD